MSVWKGLYFIEGNSPSMEQMIFFHDFSMGIMLGVFLFLLLTLKDLINLNMVNLYLMENQTIEMIWTCLPVFMLLMLAVPSLRLLYFGEESFSPMMTLKVVGHQWFWSYEYPEFNLEFDCFLNMNLKNLKDFRLLETDNFILLPVNTLMRVLVTSVDVIHSWAIPSMGVKMDAIPGRLNQMNIFAFRPGVYFGQCSEICGTGHSFMPISLKILSMEYFFNMFK